MTIKQACPKCRAEGKDSKGDHLVVFPEGSGKLTASVTTGHEIKITSICGVKSTVKRIPARTAYRRRWKAAAEICVEWAFGPQIFTGQVPVEFLQPVDHRRITVETHTFF